MVSNYKNTNLRINYRDYLPLWAKVSFNQLALYGIHLGHSINNLSPYSSWMVVGSRQGLCLINMFKFMYMFRGGLFIIQALIRRRSPIWFINLDQSSQSIIRSAALECGEYWINDNWINGLLTNFLRITKAARRTMKIPRMMWSSKQEHLTRNFRHWSLTRHTWPRAVFVSNAMMSYNACQEAMNLHIPTIGIVDTNSPQKYVNIAVPGNDESFSSVGFYNSLMSMFVLYNKFSMVNVWYINRLTYLGQDSYTSMKNVIYNVKNYYANTSVKCQVNLNEFALTSPISNVKYGTLHHYQDIWKTRGVQHMYHMAKSAQILHKNLTARVRTYYSNNQVLLYTLRNIYKYNKRWARALKIRRKNRRLKVRITTTKRSGKLFKHAWYFLRYGKVANSRLLRTQTYNFWKLGRFSSAPHLSKTLMQMYRRYLRRAYWFPKSQEYISFRSGIYNLLSTWFYLQFLSKRGFFSNFFHRSSSLLTGSIKERRTALRKAEAKHLRHLGRGQFSGSKSLNFFNKRKARAQGYEQTVRDSFLINKAYSQGYNPWQFLPKNPWYLRVMGLRYSAKKSVFINVSDQVYDIDLNTTGGWRWPALSLLDRCGKHNANVHNYGIKYVYNHWVNFSYNSKRNNIDMFNYYCNDNLDVLKPLTAKPFINTFISIRPYYIKNSSYE